MANPRDIAKARNSIEAEKGSDSSSQIFNKGKQVESRNPFSCFIIGEGTLPIRCAEILLDRGHKVSGIISADAAIKRWAEGIGTPHIDPTDDVKAFVGQQPCNYLFSIVNSNILPKEILELPDKYAINYHDALLPKYAGSHVTTWAIIGRETVHGVTWHVMSDLVDGGDILKQYPVDVADGDTAFILNAKCYLAAVHSFSELIDDLSCGRGARNKQNLNERTFFPRYQRPSVGCVFSWNRCAYDLDALIRALDFGPHPNPIGLPKIPIGGDFIIVCKSKVLDSVSKTHPGTVTGIDSGSLRLSTASQEIMVHGLLTIDGQPLSIPDVVARFGLHEGYRFNDIDPELARRITELDASICKHEAFWVERLATLQPLELPYTRRNASPVIPARYKSVPVPIPKEVTNYLGGCQTAWNPGEFLFAAFAVYLARIGKVCCFDIRYRDVELRRDLAGLEGFFASHVPLRFELDNTQGIAAAFRAVQAQLELAKRHKTYARDVVIRHRALRSVLELQRERTLAVTFEQVPRLDDYEDKPDSEFTLVVPEVGTECRWVYDVEVLDANSVAGMLRQFILLLQGIAANPQQPLSDLPMRVMTTEEFLSNLRSLNVELWADGERLRCNAPKEVLTPELSAELKDRKQDILAFLREANGASRSAVRSLQPVSRDGDLPLSFAQQRLWFFDQFEPNSPLYNIPTAVRISGSLNVEALQKVFNAIVSRHEVLRTTFATANGVPVQIIATNRPAELKMIDLSHVSAAVREGEVQRLLREESSRPFNLSSDLMLRATLLILEPVEHILLVVLHHIASDGWSLGVLFRDIAALYETFATGKPSSLPELPIQYADFTVWQRQLLQGEVLDSQLRYWKKQLADAPAILELPTDLPRPPVQSYHGARQPLLLPKTVVGGLEELSRREGVTLFMTLLAAFKILLHRYTGQDDIVVGAPAAGRNRVETEGLIGCFLNNLVLRTDLSGDPSLQELLGRVRQTALGAIAHQDLPFEKLVEELQPERALDHHPVFQVMLALQNVPISVLDLSGLTVTPLRMNSGIARFELALWMGEEEQGLTGSIDRNTVQYNTDLFDAATIARLIGHYQTLLEGIVADPNRRISDLPILTEAERHQLLVEWNDTERDHPQNKCFHDMFEAQVERTPDAVALVFDDKQLTYRELNARANQLAHHLRKLGVAPEVLVGIFLERSLEMVVALLGILKAGGAYVPLDPTYPTDRLAFMLEDSRLSVMLTQPQLVENLPPHNARLICLTAEWTEVAHESQNNVASSTTAANLAYVIYTSGSTGKPKGVQITHGALVNFLESMRQRPGITSQDVLLAVTTLSFDIAGLELYLPLTVGARVVIVGRETVTSGRELAEKLSSSGATIMQATPATWRLLIESGWEGSQQLKILCGGEALPQELAIELLDRCGSVWNMYGPTETTIWSTVYPVDSSDGAVLVGRPIANTRLFILDRYLQPVPVGVPGELCIGGAGVARGYLNRPELTDEKFITDPFSSESEARLYKTGDLARYLPDGNIELLGRIDHQVKVRGYRIELGEIEAVLREHPAIRDCVVLAREDAPGDKRLVGYVVSSKHSAPTTSELRTFLQQKLPDYMIPAAFIFPEALPLTPNGKIDRRALPAPDATRPELEAVFVAPQSGVEKILAGIWGGVLGLERVGIHDNFFDLGGHSLLLAKVHSQLQTALRRDVPMIELFRYPTIGTLAKYLGHAPEQDSLQQSAERAEKQRSAVYNRQRMQAIAERRGHQR